MQPLIRREPAWAEMFYQYSTMLTMSWCWLWASFFILTTKVYPCTLFFKSFFNVLIFVLNLLMRMRTWLPGSPAVTGWWSQESLVITAQGWLRPAEQSRRNAECERVTSAGAFQNHSGLSLHLYHSVLIQTQMLVINITLSEPTVQRNCWPTRPPAPGRASVSPAAAWRTRGEYSDINFAPKIRSNQFWDQGFKLCYRA